MARTKAKKTPAKWFSVRTDLLGVDSYQLGILALSPHAFGLYLCGISYCCRYGINYAHKNVFKMYGSARISKPLRELEEAGFITDRGDGRYILEHEGILWRRGNAWGVRPNIPTAIRAFVMKRDGFACVECGATDELSLDHIWPYSRGGTDEPDNLRVLCRSCNSKKGARTNGA